ncbi:hypothetical protein BDV29DRAFT_185158 [Aspergillus leporis]|jgi:hypothetical protein|uniref:Uncharacterized protein n=1 Tax=Aspergillus leporis TaxID=41062 RepID=A0A5N5WHX3_9EURO|nr:hypothetical protein BDV29DRAFT_185158 [Aspergillus leporis]
MIASTFKTGLGFSSAIYFHRTFASSLPVFLGISHMIVILGCIARLGSYKVELSRSKVPRN